MAAKHHHHNNYPGVEQVGHFINMKGSWSCSDLAPCFIRVTRSLEGLEEITKYSHLKLR